MEENEFERIGAVLAAGLGEVLHQKIPADILNKRRARC